MYDEAANLPGHQRQVAFNNQVTTSDAFDYTYDGFGRMAQRRVRDSAVCQHYQYDAEHRITAVTFEHDSQGLQRAEYDYDILGRRTVKRVWQSVQAQRLSQPPAAREPEETVQFSWNGLRLAGETSSKSAHLTLHYVYNSGSYNPLARIECFDHPEKQSTDISYYHVALNGLPEELTDSQGRIVWHGEYSLWGKLKREQRPVPGFRGQQNLRFQGQYFDRETGLHYNTFRYYAPDTGRFTQQDPIGLAGGLNLYQYAPNPVTWIDPLGLSSCALGRNIGAKTGDGMANHHLISEELMKDNNFKSVFDRLKRIGWNGDGASNGAFLPGSKDLASTMGIPGHWSNHNQYTGAVRNKLSQLASQANRLSDTQLALGIKEIQDWARKGLDNGVFKIDPNTGRLL